MTCLVRLTAVAVSAGLSRSEAEKLAREAVAADDDMRGVVLRRICGLVDWRSPHGQYILSSLKAVAPEVPR